MLVQHSTAVIINQLAAKEAQSPETDLALIAKMRAQMALDALAEMPDAPKSDIEAAEHLLDKSV